MDIILASASPRRRALMKNLNIPFEVVIVPHEEKLNRRKSVYNQCLDIAYQKAKIVYDKEKDNDNVIVIGSDTIVVHDKKIFGKPHDYNEAFNMIKTFSGNKHEVVTSLVMLIRKDGHEYEEKLYDVSYVYIDEMTDEEINEWLENSDPYSKAGGYAIQEGFMKYVTKIEGDYTTIVGLPLNKVYRLLKKYI